MQYQALRRNLEPKTMVEAVGGADFPADRFSAWRQLCEELKQQSLDLKTQCWQTFMLIGVHDRLHSSSNPASNWQIRTAVVFKRAKQECLTLEAEKFDVGVAIDNDCEGQNSNRHRRLGFDEVWHRLTM